MRMKKALTAIWASIFMLAMIILPMVFPIVSNAEEPHAEVLVELPVSCVGKNTSEQFQYILSTEEEDMPHQTVESYTLSLENGESGEFCISYHYPGTYHYTVSQKKGTDAETKYDDTVYMADVYVTADENGKLMAEPLVYVYGNSGKKACMDFINERKMSDETGKTDGTDETEKTAGTEKTAQTGKNGKAANDHGTPDNTSSTGNIQRSSAKTGDPTSVWSFVCVSISLFVIILLGVFAKQRKDAENDEEE